MSRDWPLPLPTPPPAQAFERMATELNRNLWTKFTEKSSGYTCECSKDLCKPIPKPSKSMYIIVNLQGKSEWWILEVQTWHACANKLTLQQGTFQLPCLGIWKRSTKLSDVRTWQIHRPSCLQAYFPSALDVVYHVWRTALQLSPQIACRLCFRPQSVWLWQYGSTSCMLWSAKQFGWKTTAAEGQDTRKLQPAQYIVIWDTFLIWFGVMIIHLQFTHCILKRILSIQLSRFSIAKPGSDQSPLTGQRHPVNNTLSQEMPRTPTNRRTEEHLTTMRAKLCQIEICTNFLPSLDTFHPSLQLLQSLLGVSFLLPTLLFGSWWRLRCPSERHLWRRDRTWQSADFKAGEFAFVIGLITSKS